VIIQRRILEILHRKFRVSVRDYIRHVINLLTLRQVVVRQFYIIASGFSERPSKFKYMVLPFSSSCKIGIPVKTDSKSIGGHRFEPPGYTGTHRKGQITYIGQGYGRFTKIFRVVKEHVKREQPRPLPQYEFIVF